MDLIKSEWLSFAVWNWLDADLIDQFSDMFNTHQIYHNKKVVSYGFVILDGDGEYDVKGFAVARASGSVIIKASDDATVYARDNVQVVARNRTYVQARHNVHVQASGHSSVIGFDQANVGATDQVRVWVMGSVMVDANREVTVSAGGHSQINLKGAALCWAYDKSHIKAEYNSIVRMFENSTVEAEDYALVIGYDNSVQRCKLSDCAVFKKIWSGEFVTSTT